MTELDYLKLTKEKPHMDPNQPENSAVKPGYKSSEFWLSLAAVAIGYLLTSGVLDSNDEGQARIIKGLVAIAGILGALGYSGLRTSAKKSTAEAAAAIAIEKVRAAVPQPPAST